MQDTRESRSRGSLRYIAQTLLVAIAVTVLLVQPSPAWIERHFSNGYYARWQHLISTITLPLPFSLGDLVGLAFIAIAVAILVRGHRAKTRFGFVPALARTALNLATLAAVAAIWFYASWGWGYSRAPLETRVAYDSARANPAAVDGLRRTAIAHMNALAPRAHAGSHAFDSDALRAAWEPVVQRAGDVWTPNVGRTKISIAAPVMNANGTSGFVNPFTVESQLATDLLWFELPFTTAHEWSHAAGYNREDEANYIAVIACLRDSDVVAQYSGWFELFLYLPPLQKYPKSTFTPEVWSDFAALRERNAHFVNVRFSQLSWHAYNNYLKTNRIAAGVRNYDEVTRLMLGVPLDSAGLPQPRS